LKHNPLRQHLLIGTILLLLASSGGDGAVVVVDAVPVAAAESSMEKTTSRETDIIRTYILNDKEEKAGGRAEPSRVKPRRR